MIRKLQCNSLLVRLQLSVFGTQFGKQLNICLPPYDINSMLTYLYQPRLRAIVFLQETGGLYELAKFFLLHNMRL